MYLFLKRTADIIISLVAILIFSPVFIILPFFIMFFLGTPVIFKQKRIGKNNKIIVIRKFRSMKNVYDANGNLLPDKDRLGTFGKILRKSSLDELPQLFSILIGDMTIIGPRPRMIEEIYFMQNTKYIYRACMRPGITGWAVIHGRNNMSIIKALEYDLEYISKASLFLDIKIFIKTFFIVFKKEGIYADGKDAPMNYYVYLLENNFLTQEKFNEEMKIVKSIIHSSQKYLNDVDYDFKNVSSKVRKDPQNVDKYFLPSLD